MNHGQHVKLNRLQENPVLTGKIMGTGAGQRYDNTFIQFFYIVELDQGFYNEDKTIWTSIMVVDKDSVTPID